MLLQNTSKSVKVFKAMNRPTLRLIPGCNVAPDNHNDYFKSKAAAALKKSCIVEIMQGNETAEQLKEAEIAKKKTDRLNQGMPVTSPPLSKKDLSAMERQAANEALRAAINSRVPAIDEDLIDLLQDMTVDELRGELDEADVDIPSGSRKADLIQLVYDKRKSDEA